MIQRSQLHTCTSYTCLLSLTEKPTCFNTAERTFAPMSRRIELNPSVNPKPCLMNETYLRSDSPLTVVFDEDNPEDEAPTDDYLFTQSLSHSLSFSLPLNGPSPTSRTFEGKTRVTFNPTVQVTCIPSHRDYSAAMKRRIWASPEEIRVNVVKAKMQLYFEEDEYAGDNYMPKSEANESGLRFAPLRPIQTAL